VVCCLTELRIQVTGIVKKQIYTKKNSPKETYSDLLGQIYSHCHAITHSSVLSTLNYYFVTNSHFSEW